MHKPSFRIPASLAFALILATTWLIYAPGLSGGFLFDDFANLPALGSSGPITHWATFWRYITSGTADPTGRPLTLLTFLLDARDWPADPFPFKRTSLILHLVNGALLAWLLRNLGQALPWLDARRINAAAVLGAGLWLVHPLFVSTTLYIVQREAMLPATFTLFGLLLWLRGRRLLGQGRIAAGLLWIAMGLGGCTVLGTLSKANGALLPALALVIEYVLLRAAAWPAGHSGASERGRQAYRWALLALAGIPTVLIAGYLLQQGWLGMSRGISAARPWTLGQRLLTEPRVLMDYLDLLWLPRPFTPGVFNDQIVASTSLFSPWSTLPALLVMLGLIAGAWLWRQRQPALALAVLFYFVAQSLESSTIALELYFEHRNYLPAMLMFWPLALWLCDARHADPTTTAAMPGSAGTLPRPWANAKLLLGAVLLLGLALMTHARASLWGNTHDQALLWAQLNPASARAQANAAAAEMHAGLPALAVARLRSAVAQSPDQVQLALNLFNAQCQLGQIDKDAMLASATALRTSRDTGTLLASWFEHAMDELHAPPCPQLNTHTLAQLLDAAAGNPFLLALNGRRQDLYYLKGRLALIQGDPNTALADFNRALDQEVRVSAALAQSALLGAKGFPRQGLAHLDHFSSLSAKAEQPGFGMPRIHAWVLQKQQYWSGELAHLRETLRADATHQEQAGTQ